MRLQPMYPKSPPSSPPAFAEQQQFEAAFEMAPIGMALLDREARILRANRALTAIVGLRGSDLVGRSLDEFVPHEDTESLAGVGERRLLHGDGHVVWVHVARSPLPDGMGGEAGFIVQLQDITERVLVEQMLRESEERFRNLTMLTSDWYWEQDAEFRFTSLAPGLAGVWRPDFSRSGGASSTGRTGRASAIGKRVWEQPDTMPVSGSWADHRKTLEAHLPFRDFEYMRTFPDGHTHVASVSGEPFFDASGRFKGYRGTARDISAARQAEQQLKDAQSLLHMAAQIGRLGAWTYDVRTDDMTWSEEVCAMHELPQATRMTQSGAMLFYAEGSRPSMQERWRACLADGTPFDVEAQAITARGRAFWVRVICEADWDAHGKVVRLRGACQDISDAKAARDEVLMLNAELEERVQHRTAQLQEVNRELESFSYSIAHDLRGPLSTIDGFTRVLEQGLGVSLDDKQLHYMQRVRAGVRTMDELTQGLLSLSHVSQAELAIEHCDLTKIAQAVIDELKLREPSRAVEVAIEPGLAAAGDPHLLHLLMSNLLGNAWKFTSAKPGARIAFRRLRSGDGPDVFCVEDDGAGFDMTYAGSLFRAFHRMHTPAEFEGNGIGLALVQKIVLRHGGRVWADAVPGHGARFSFTLSRLPAST